MSIAVATQVPFVVAPVRVRRHPAADPRPTHHQIYVRRRVAVLTIAALAATLLWLAGGALLTSRGGAPASTPAVRQPAALAPATYQAQPGDSLFSIARQFHGSVPTMAYVDQLVRLNGGVTIDVGQQIRLP